MYPIDEILRKGSALADEVEVYLTEGISLSGDLKREKVSRAIESRYFGLSIRTIREGKIGISSSSNPSDWKSCLEASVTSGKLATPQPWEGLPEPVLLDTTPLSYDPTLTTDKSAIVSLLEQMREGARAHPVEVTSGGAAISVQNVTLANTNDLFYTRSISQVSASIETIKGNSTGYEFGNSHTNDINPRSIGDRAGFLAEASSGGTDIATGTYDVVLSSVAFAQLIGAVLLPALSGRNVHAGRSKLAESRGLQVIDPVLSITDDPFLAKGLSSTRWDAEGVPTRRIPFIRNGILEYFSYDLKTAYRFGHESTGSAVRTGHGGAPAIGSHNIIVEGPRIDTMEESALYIQDVVGAHTANPLSGDFSVELTNPFHVSGGNYEVPVRKAMMSGNVFEMLGDIGGLGRDDRIIGSMMLPSVRLNKQHIIGT